MVDRTNLTREVLLPIFEILRNAYNGRGNIDGFFEHESAGNFDMKDTGVYRVVLVGDTLGNLMYSAGDTRQGQNGHFSFSLNDDKNTRHTLSKNTIDLWVKECGAANPRFSLIKSS